MRSRRALDVLIDEGTAFGVDKPGRYRSFREPSMGGRFGERLERNARPSESSNTFLLHRA